tara:strand:- start:9133 stop:11088 length:1956 start_codon:yes stop_codon:yes gene_type:complete
MSFLPHAPSRSAVWFGSLAASAITHVCITSFILFSGSVIFLRKVETLEVREPSFEITFQILDIDSIDVSIPIEEISDDEMGIEPDELDASIPDDIFDELAPVYDALVPDTETTLPSNIPPGELTLEFGSEVLEPEMPTTVAIEVDISETKALKLQVIKPQLNELELAEIMPEPILGQVPSEGLIVKEEVPKVQPIEQEQQELKVIEPELFELELEPNQMVSEAIDTQVPVEQEVIAVAPNIVSEPVMQKPIAVEVPSPLDKLILSPLADNGSLLIQQDVLTQGSNELALLSPIKETVLPLSQPQENIVAPTVLTNSDPKTSNLGEVDSMLTGVQDLLDEGSIGSVIEEEFFNDTQAVVLEPSIQQPTSSDETSVIDGLVLSPDPVGVAIPPDLSESDVVDELETEGVVSGISLGSDVPELKPSEIATDTSVNVANKKPQFLPNPTVSDISIGKLLRRIRELPQQQCTLALPRRAGGVSGAGLSLIGADVEQLQRLGKSINEGLDFEPQLLSEIIDPRQCAVLDALRQSDSYPANRIGLSLESTELESGSSLRGTVIGAGGLYLTLLLIDDNGVVQDVAPFVTDGASLAFDAPVARSGPARTTRQILLALGTTDETLDFSGQIGLEAQDVFTANSAQQLQKMVFGVATFDLQ